MIKSTIKEGLLYILLAFCVSCSTSKRDKKYYERLISTTEADAICSLQGANNSSAEGRAIFIAIGDTADHVVGMAIKMEKLTPGKHALHMHQFGECGFDAKAAGGHWNPTDVPHGKRGGDKPFHNGDILNLEADSDGNAFWFGDIRGWTIGGGEGTNILGKSLVIHAQKDDFASQPGGNAGMRIACGKIDSLDVENEPKE